MQRRPLFLAILLCLVALHAPAADDYKLGADSLPQPGTPALLSLGLMGLGLSRRRKLIRSRLA